MSDPSNQDQSGFGDQSEEPTERLAIANQSEVPTERLAVPDRPEEQGPSSFGPLDPATAGEADASVLLPEQLPTAKIHSLPAMPPSQFPGVPAPEAPFVLPEQQPTAKLRSTAAAPPPAPDRAVVPIEDAETLPRVWTMVSAPVERPEAVAVPTIPPASPTRPARPAPPRIGIDRRFTLTLVAIAIAFLLVGAGILIAGYNAAQTELRPAQAAQAFCRDLQSQNYNAAYVLLASSYQSQVTVSQFAQASRLQDQVDGKIRACPTATGPGIDLSFGTPRDHQSFLVTIVRNKALSGHIALVREDGAWKVEGLEQSLAGTNLGPLLVADTFCQALVEGNYATAYATLSSRQQGLATEQVFATQFSSALGGPVKLNSCTLDYSTYSIRSGAAAISATFNLTISTSTGGTLSTNLKTVLSFIQESGAWKVDDFSLQPSASS